MKGASITLGLQRRARTATPSNPLRAVTTSSKVLYSKDARPSKTMSISRYPFIMGTDATSLAVLACNWFMNQASLDNTGNAFTIVDMAIETTGGVTAPVTFGGSRSRTLADGENDVVSDEVSPAALGLSVFAKNTQFWIKIKLLVATAGQYIPHTAVSFTQFTGAQGAWYDPAVTTMSSTDAAGQYTATGTAMEARFNTFCPMILGRPVVDGPSYIVIGDSIAEGIGDANSGMHGHGFVQRAMHAAGNTGAALYPCLNLARSGTVALTGLSKRIALYKYARYAIEEIGTNDLGPAGTGDAAALKTKTLAVWQELRTAGIEKIVRTTLIPRTTSTDSFATIANQTPGAGFVVGGKAEDMNAWYAARLSDGTIEKLVYMNSIRAPEDFWKYKVNGTANYTAYDGTHPSAQGHEFMAEDLRAVLATIT